jgi:hypothetical protein
VPAVLLADVSAKSKFTAPVITGTGEVVASTTAVSACASVADESATRAAVAIVVIRILFFLKFYLKVLTFLFALYYLSSKKRTYANLIQNNKECYN